jgi:hypothetical protein
MRNVVRQVEVPPDLQNRLHAALAIAANPVQLAVTIPVEATERPQSRASRRAFLLATSAAALLFAAGWKFVVTHRPPAPLLAETVLDWWQERFSQSPGFDVGSLPEFDGGFEPAVADGRWQSQLIGPPRGVDIDEDGRDDAAVFAMKVKGGFLVVLPPGRVSDPPSKTSALTADRGYAPVPHVAWTQGDSMHICYLPGVSSRQLESLLKQVHTAA